VWIARNETRETILGEPFNGLFTVDLAPGAQRAVVTARGAVIVNARSGEPSSIQLNPVDGSGYLPMWSPDGKRVAFGIFAARPPQGLIVSADGAGVPERFPVGGWIWDWSRDGKYLLVDQVDEKNGQDLATIDLSVPPDQRKSIPFLSTPAAESHAKFSPDSRWVAYTSNTTGQNEVWVESFPPGKGKWMISRDGGDKPRWRRDGREIFYYSPSERIMAVPVRPGSGFDPGPPKEVAKVALTGPVGWPYDVTADGQRFLVIPEERVEHFQLILNWPAMLKKP